MLGTRLEEPLRAIVQTVLAERSNDPIQAFDVVSKRIRSQKLAPRLKHQDSESTLKAQLTDICARNSTLSLPTDPETKDPLPLCEVPDIEQQLSLCRRAGVGFPASEAHFIALMFRKLASNASLTSLRFWGKILTRAGEYIIAESVPAEGGEVPSDEDPLGTGVNRYQYYAYHTSSEFGPSDWLLLPNASPATIRASRSVKTILSGDIEDDVPGKKFPGNFPEGSLLRAQIARITAATRIAPKGEFKDEGGTVSKVEDFRFEAVPSVFGLLSNWVHSEEYILLNAKTKYPDVPEVEQVAENADEETKRAAANESDRVEALKREMHFDPMPARLRSLDQDKTGKWAIRVYGDLSSYKGRKANHRESTIAVRSRDWPGAVTVAHGSEYVHLYCGYGIKRGGMFFPSPVDANELWDDKDDPFEASEPHAKKAADDGDPSAKEAAEEEEQ